MSDPRRICWDANAFIDLLEPSAEHHQDLRDIVSFAEARSSQLEIVTSSLAIAEVAGLVRGPNGKDLIGILDMSQIEAVWEKSVIIVVDLSPAVARLGQELVRLSYEQQPETKTLKGPDAVYVATAKLTGADILVTRDGRLLHNSGLGGIQTRTPDQMRKELTPQLSLPLPPPTPVS